MKKYLIACFSFFLILGCTATKNKSTEQNEVTALANLMTGSFSSKAQSEADKDYYDISLHMYPIWKKHSSTQIQWLYVEQALSSKQDKPYRQRVYKVEALANGTYKSTIYKLPNEADYIGKWNTPKFFNNISPENLEIREGCAVYLAKIGDNSYAGRTKEGECSSTLRGASYATSVVEMSKDQVISWDQGFDKEGKQVWGAEKGGYIFIKL